MNKLSKRVNFFATISPQRQQTFFTWVRWSVRLLAIIGIIAAIITAKLLFDLGRAQYALWSDSHIAATCDAITKRSQSIKQEQSTIAARTATLKKIIDTPYNPYSYINAITGFLTSDLELTAYTISIKDGCILEGQSATLIAIDTFAQKLQTSPLFENITVQSIQRGSTSNADSLLLQFKIVGNLII